MISYKRILKGGLLAIIALLIWIAIDPGGISVTGSLTFVWSYLHHQIVERPFAGVEDFKQAGIAGGIILISLSLLLYTVFLVFYISVFSLCLILLRTTSTVVSTFFYDHPISSSALTLAASLGLSLVLWPFFIHIWVVILKYVFIAFWELKSFFSS